MVSSSSSFITLDFIQHVGWHVEIFSKNCTEEVQFVSLYENIESTVINMIFCIFSKHDLVYLVFATRKYVPCAMDLDFLDVVGDVLLLQESHSIASSEAVQALAMLPVADWIPDDPRAPGAHTNPQLLWTGTNFDSGWLDHSAERPLQLQSAERPLKYQGEFLIEAIRSLWQLLKFFLRIKHGPTLPRSRQSHLMRLIP